jgi:mRNA-degrading endonuclease RelE of RelBE toxin-antitoxin system
VASGWAGGDEDSEGQSVHLALTKQAEMQLEQLDESEREQIEGVMAALVSPGEVRLYGHPVGESPAGTVWRIRAGRIGVFVAIDEDSLLVVGFAVRRGGSGWFDGWS